MDPASAIGVASAVLSFIEFAWNITKGTIEVYKSVDGATKANARLEKLLADIGAANQEMKVIDDIKTPAEKRIRDLAQQCESDRKVLVKLLRVLKRDPKQRSYWSSLKLTMKGMSAKREMDEFKANLKERQEQLIINLSLLLR